MNINKELTHDFLKWLMRNYSVRLSITESDANLFEQLYPDLVKIGEKIMKITVRKKPMDDFDWHYCQSLNSFIQGIENGEDTKQNIQMAFFVKDNPITGEGEIYYEPAITSLNTNYLREMRDKLNFKIVMVFGGGGIED